MDTGVGIDVAELPKIFDRFYRGSRASEARSSGSGLGLAIVRSVVDMHSGRVMVESRVGGGSTFTVTLPADPRSPDGPTAGPPTDVSASGGKTPAPQGATQARKESQAAKGGHGRQAAALVQAGEVVQAGSAAPVRRGVEARENSRFDRFSGSGLQIEGKIAAAGCLWRFLHRSRRGR